MRYRIALAGVVLLAAFSAHAQTYKCVVNGQTQYSDQPCGAATTVIRSSAAMQGASGSTAAGSNVMRQLDAAVATALSDGDIARAESLAVTAEQWQMVNQAKRNAAMDVAARRAEIDRAKQLKATEDLAREAARPRKCVTNSHTSGFIGDTTISANTTGVTTCK